MEAKKIFGAKIPRTDMPCQAPAERVKNFKEVALGYTSEMAAAEASRCLQCKKPLCRSGCPVEVRIPEFIARVAIQGWVADMTDYMTSYWVVLFSAAYILFYAAIGSKPSKKSE